MADKSSRAGRSLTQRRIVELAIERADTDGLEGLSMRKLAADLSVTPMALYWHFANRDALLDAMAEEVAGDAAVLVDPLDPDAIAAGIAEASERHEELRRLGLERAASFSWAEAARATVEVYREAAG